MAILNKNLNFDVYIDNLESVTGYKSRTKTFGDTNFPESQEDWMIVHPYYKKK
jgi:hypothetical protein